jgi:hypothetical protein
MTNFFSPLLSPPVAKRLLKQFPSPVSLAEMAADSLSAIVTSVLVSPLKKFSSDTCERVDMFSYL